MTKVVQQRDLLTVIQRLSERVATLEKGPQVTSGGTITLTDPNGTGQKIVVGTLPDGSFGIQIGNVTIEAVAGTVTSSGAVTAGGLITTGNAYVGTIQTGGNSKFVISTDGSSLYFTAS